MLHQSDLTSTPNTIVTVENDQKSISFQGYGIDILFFGRADGGIWKLMVNKDDNAMLSVCGKKDIDLFSGFLIDKSLPCLFKELNNWYWNLNEEAQVIKKILLPVINQLKQMEFENLSPEEQSKILLDEIKKTHKVILPSNYHNNNALLFNEVKDNENDAKLIVLNKKLDNYPANVSNRIKRADLYMRRNEYNHAYQDYKFVHDLYPGNTIAEEGVRKCEKLLIRNNM